MVNKDDELVIRPLNQEEKDWLDRYYSETLNTSFTRESFFPIKGAEKLSTQEVKNIRQEFLTDDKTIDGILLNDEKHIKNIANKYQLPELTIINLMERKKIYDANNALNNDYIKIGLRASCEMKCENEEDYYHPVDEYYLNNTNTFFEEAMNSYLDFKNRREMGWDDLEDLD